MPTPAMATLWNGFKQLSGKEEEVDVVDLAFPDVVDSFIRINFRSWRIQKIDRDGGIRDESPFKQEDLFGLVHNGVPSANSTFHKDLIDLLKEMPLPATNGTQRDFYERFYIWRDQVKELYNKRGIEI